MNRIGRLAIVVGLAALAVWGCSDAKEADNGKDVLVTVNGEAIKTQDLQIAWNSLPVDQRKDYNSPKGIITLLDELVSYRMMAQEAENRKLDQDPLFKKRMELFRQRLLVSALVEQSMTEADLMNYFQRNFLRAVFIRVGFPEGATPAQKSETRSRADRALTQLKGGTDFRDVMENYSNYLPNETGELGYVTHGTIENMVGFEAAEALFALKEPGQYTEVVEGKNGYYIFNLLEPTGKLDVRGLTPELSEAIRGEMREQVIRSLAVEIKSRSDFKVERNEANLAELMKSLESNWAQIGDGSTAAPAAGSTAAPVPTAGATTPAVGATPEPAAPPAEPDGGATPEPAVGASTPASGATP